MSTAKPKPKRDPPPLPPGCEALLGKDQVRQALAISPRMLDKMISGGEFPRADFRVGTLLRWRVATFNAWVSARCGSGKE